MRRRLVLQDEKEDTGVATAAMSAWVCYGHAHAMASAIAIIFVVATVAVDDHCCMLSHRLWVNGVELTHSVKDHILK